MIIVSCIFGTKFKKVHKAPSKNDCYFFTNNSDLENHILQKGWIYIYIHFPLTTDYLQSSLQSKYIKFIQFLDDFSELKEKFMLETVVYVDHKELLVFESLDEIQSLIDSNPTKDIIIRVTPTNKTNINQEIQVCKHQARYKQNISKTEKTIQNLILNEDIRMDVRISNTGLIIYNNYQTMTSLTNKVYSQCMQDQQPECQIYWAAFSQLFSAKILQIEWKQLKTVKRINP